jgi:hypothetical protein
MVPRCDAQPDGAERMVRGSDLESIHIVHASVALYSYMRD